MNGKCRRTSWQNASSACRSPSAIRGRPSTVAQTGPLARELDERQYDRGYGPCLDSIDGGEPLLVHDMHDEPRWPDRARAAAELGAARSLSIPVPLQREVLAALDISSTQSDAFDDDSVELAWTFAAYAGVALANMHLYSAQGQVAEQLQTAMRARAVIEQAKGVLMGQRRCTSQGAFDVLVERSQHTNRKLRDVAQAVVEEATSTGGPGS